LTRPGAKRKVDFSETSFETICEIKFLYENPGRSKKVIVDFKRMRQVIQNDHAENAYVIYMQRMIFSGKPYRQIFKKWQEAKAVKELKKVKRYTYLSKNFHYVYFVVFYNEITNKTESFKKSHIITNMDIPPL
jgi:hypothetical protein